MLPKPILLDSGKMPDELCEVVDMDGKVTYIKYGKPQHVITDYCRLIDERSGTYSRYKKCDTINLERDRRYSQPTFIEVR